MYISIVLLLIISSPSAVDLCDYQVTNTTGTILFPSYGNNIECIWLFNLSALDNASAFRTLSLIFRHFDTEFAHDELLVGETIADVARYNSKLLRFSGSKLPEPVLIPLRGDPLLRPIWMQFVSDQSTTGSGFTLDYAFLVNQSLPTAAKYPKVLISADIRHPSDSKFKSAKSTYSFPYGNISSPNHPQDYPNNIIFRWHLFHRHACLRLLIETFNTELHYDTLTVYLGQSLKNRAMVLYEWSGNELENKHLFIPNDNVVLVFQTDMSNSASGFSLRYEIIEKETFVINVEASEGVICSRNYPRFLRTNSEYTWVIRTNDTNQVEINLIDSQLDSEHDHLQVITGELVYTLDTPKSYLIHTTNETKLVLRTKHSDDDYRYRGFNLTYQKSNALLHTNDESRNLPCGKKYSSPNGTIEFHHHRTLTSFDCLILIEVDDGQNIFLRFDHFDWDNEENYIEIGLFHNPDEFRIFHISDTLPGTWFIANDSQIWIRFYSSQFSLADVCSFRLFYSETIRWSTVSPKPYVQVLDDHRLFPYRLISLPTNSIYHNLTQAYLWWIEALDDECIQIRFESLQAIEDRRICFHVKDSLSTSQICSNQPFPFVYYHVGSCVLSIEPEFTWMLVKYDLQINKFKKMTLIHYLTFYEENMTLTPSMSSEPYVHIEWHLSLNESSTIIFDIENFDGKTPAELILPQTGNTTKRYSLGTILATRFSHVLSSSPTSVRITYTSLSLPIDDRKRSFQLNLYKVSRSYFTLRDFHYISFKTNQTDLQWSIQGQHEHSIFLAKLFSASKNLSLQTTANVHLSAKHSAAYIPSSNFDIRYNRPKNAANDGFIAIFYEQREMNLYRHVIVNRTSSLIETNDFALYDIHLQSTIADSIDFVIIKGDNGTFIRVYDLNARHNGYFRLNLSSTSAKQVPSPAGLHFSVRSLHIKIELQSRSKTPIQLRYKTHIGSNHSHRCLITGNNVCHGNTTPASSTCIDSCSSAFDHISPAMNNTGGHRFWPNALRGSVTLVIENTTIDNFEKAIYRQLRYSIAKIIRKFCLKYEPTCLSKDADSVRADHVIIQSYEEESADQRLFVAIFIKDPYRPTVALSNDQFLLALKRYRQDIYDDIKHHIQLPSNILEHSSLDPIWLYGICLLVLFVLIVVLLVLILILAKKTFCSTSQNQRMNKTVQRVTPERDRLIISSPFRLATEEDEQISSTCYNDTDTSQASNFTATASLLPPPSSSAYPHRPNNRPSYFNSNIETAIKQRLDNDDSEPIPFIDDNLSTAHSRKSSACWSDRTSLSSRFSLAWKFHSRRSGSHNRSTVSNSHEKRRKYPPRPLRYTIPVAQQNQPNDEL